jgi:transposase
LFVEAVLYRYQIGILWRDLPERFGDFRVVHTRFSSWEHRGVWKWIFQHLCQDVDNEYAMIDAIIVRVYPYSAEAQKRHRPNHRAQQKKSELSTKIHAAVDALGNSLSFYPTGGRACDLDGADVPLPQLASDALLIDKGYDADDRVLVPWSRAEKEAVIPPKANRKAQRKYDKELYKVRHLIENFFEKFKQYKSSPSAMTKLRVTPWSLSTSSFQTSGLFDDTP